MNSIEQTLQEITEGVIWYRDNSDKATPSELLRLRKGLSTRSYFLASFVAECESESDKAYYNRKKQYSISLIELGKSNRKKDRSDRLTANELTAQADIDNEVYRKQEIEAKRNLTNSKNLLRQLNEILGTLNSHVSFLKAEMQSTPQNQT